MTSEEHRVKHGRARKRSGQWKREAEALARETGIDVARILDVHEEQTLMREWDGESPADAEWNAWLSVVALFSRRAA